MANPVAAYAYSIDPPRRSGGPILDAEPVRAGHPRVRPQALRLVYDAATERTRDPASLAGSRPRLYEATSRDAGFGEADELLRDAGRRKASPGLSFAAQHIAQEVLSPGLHFENYAPALAAYGTAARHGTPAAERGSSLHILA